MGLTIEGLARLCGLKPDLVGAYEAGKHSASHSMRREIFLALQSLETIRAMLPDFRPEDPRQAAVQLDSAFQLRATVAILRMRKATRGPEFDE